MSSNLFGLIELLLVFGVVFGWGGWQIWDWQRWRKQQREKANVEPIDKLPVRHPTSVAPEEPPGSPLVPPSMTAEAQPSRPADEPPPAHRSQQRS